MHDEMTPEQAAVLGGLESGRAERVPELAARLGLDQ